MGSNAGALDSGKDVTWFELGFFEGESRNRSNDGVRDGASLKTRSDGSFVGIESDGNRDGLVEG